MLPPLSPTPVPLCVTDIIMGTDHLKKQIKEGFSNNVNDKLLGVKASITFWLFGLVQAFCQQTASLQHKYKKENDLHIELPVELSWQTQAKVTKVWNMTHFSNVLTGKRENEDLGTRSFLSIALKFNQFF